MKYRSGIIVSMATNDSVETKNSDKVKRITSYDVFRGLLLVCMVFFHLLVNLSDVKFDQNYFYFVPLGFMLFLGVILGQFLKGSSRKVLVLGAKLAAIFFVFNVPKFVSLFSGEGSLAQLDLVKLAVGDQKIFSFEILLPMSLVAFASIGIWRVGRVVRGRVASGCGAGIISSVVATVVATVALISLLTYMYFVNVYSYNLSFFIYGLIGYFIGENLDLDGIARRMSGWKLIVVFVAIVAPFFVIGRFGIVEVLVILQVLALYFLVTKAFDKNKFLIFLGKNSLALYIAHIVVIKAVMGIVGSG